MKAIAILITRILATQRRLGLCRDYTDTQLCGHRMHIIFIQAQFLRNLAVGQIQPHQIQAQYPDLQRLMVARKHRHRQIVKVACAARIVVFLARRLGLIRALFGNRFRTATRAPANAVRGPSRSIWYRPASFAALSSRY